MRKYMRVYGQGGFQGKLEENFRGYLATVI